MLATAFARLTVGRAAPTLIQGALTRCALQQSLPSNIRALASEAIPTEPKPPRKPRAVKPKAEGTAEKATKAVKKTTKKAAKAVTPKKAKAPKKAPKPKPWEARDADGKLLPLPSATKPRKTNPYVLYLSSRISALKTDPAMMRDGSSDKLDVTKVTKAIGDEWKGLSASEKKPFEDECREKNLQVDKALIEWRNSLTSEDIRRQNAYLRDQKKKGKSGSGKLDDPSKPKHPLTSFFIFLKEFRDRNEGSVIELGSKAGAEWKAMSEEQKQPYVQEAEKAKASYLEAMKSYLPSS